MSELSRTVFISVLKADPKDKAKCLKISEAITQNVITDDFRSIPNSPFAYWLTKGLRDVFKDFPTVEEKYAVKQGLATADDFRFLRLWWEIEISKLGFSTKDTQDNRGWVHFSKGGGFKRYYADIYLTVNWLRNAYSIRNFSKAYIRNEEKYFSVGITWTLRTSRMISFRVLPKGCIFGHKGPIISVYSGNPFEILGLLNASIFQQFIDVSLGAAAAAARSYEVGTVANVPITPSTQKMVDLTSSAFKLNQEIDTATETSHAFRLTWLLQFPANTLSERFTAYQTFIARTEAELAHLQAEIDELAFDLYVLSEEDRALIRTAMSEGAGAAARATDGDALEEATEVEGDEAEDADEEEAAGADLATLSHALLSWCVGAAFGRWDVRMALDAGLTPELQGPFERLPVVAPAGLVGVDGYPAQGGQVAPMEWLKARSNVISLPEGEWHNMPDYPLNVAWDGILVSDQGGPNDLATRVRLVLRQVFGEQAENMEEEALRAIQGDKKATLTLDDYLRQPKHFFATHLKGYSRSRRKAPIYWPLMHKDAPDFVVWVYYPRMDAQTLPRVLTDVVLPRLDSAKAEVGRLQAERAASDNAKTARALEQAEDFARGLGTLTEELRRVVNAGYTPEHDDGAILSAAPLHAIFPWKDLAGMFHSVQAGKYPWSHQHGIWPTQPKEPFSESGTEKCPARRRAGVAAHAGNRY